MAVLVSGRGGNLEALLAAGIRVSLVVADRKAPALDIARGAEVPVAMIDGKFFQDRESFGDALLATLRAHAIDLVVLAGFMRVLAGKVVQYYQGRMVNIHPSLLPDFPGLDTHARALAAGAKAHGCTAHWVTEEVDQGPIIRQAEVPVLKGDDVETLAARVAAAEHRLYPEVVRDVIAGRELPPS